MVRTSACVAMAYVVLGFVGLPAAQADEKPSATGNWTWEFRRPNGGEAFKQGAIGVDKNLSGELKLETVSKDFDVFITAEQSDSVTSPSSVEVLSTHVSMN